MGKLLAILAALALAAAGPALAEAPCTLQKIADLPVVMSGLRPLINAQINGQPVRLFIDTGSFMSTLSPATAARLNLRTQALPPWIHVQGLTGEADMRQATAKVFTLLGVPFHNVDFLVADHGISADGLIGEDVLGKLDIEYDFANGVVRLFRPANCGDRALAYWSQDGSFGMASLLPSDEHSKQILSTATLNGQKIRVVLDTGSPRSAMKLSAARRAGINVDAPGVVSGGSTQGAGRRAIASWVAPFSSFEFGGEQVKGTRLRVAAYELEDADMLLGTDFFLSHRIFISRGQRKLYFTYNGGPVFNLEQGGSAPAPPTVADTATSSSLSPTETPKDADGFSRRAAAEASRHEYEAAIADETSAIGLAPQNAEYLYNRGATRLLNHQRAEAMADLDAALKLKPDLKDALMARGALRLEQHDELGAKADFDAVLAGEPGLAVTIANLYLATGHFEAAAARFGQSIDHQPKSQEAAGALGGRCRARAMWGQELDGALADCNQAIKYRPGAPNFLASRGLVELRQGRLDPAVADFNRAIALQPRSPWALYGRGAAEIRQGKKVEGDADLAAAATIDPRIPIEARRLGLAPG